MGETVERFKISRRSFIQYVAGAAAALGLSEAAIMKLGEQIANAGLGPIKVVWIEGQMCGGCATSLLQLRQKSGRTFDVYHTAAGVGDTLDALQATWARPWSASDATDNDTTTVDDILVDVLDIQLIRIAGSAAGDQWFKEFEYLVHTAAAGSKPDLMVVDGAIPVDGAGVIGKRACYIASDSAGGGGSNHTDALTAYDAVRDLATAMVAAGAGTGGRPRAGLAFGTCSSFGGVPAGRNLMYKAAAGIYKSSGAASLSTALTGTGLPVINLPGCAPNPNTLYLVAAQYILGAGALLGSNIDSQGRPKVAAGVNLFRNTIHGRNCPRYSQYTAGMFAAKPGDPGCLAMIGCRGLFTYAPCYQSNASVAAQPYWNDQMSSCISQGAPCQGCHEKGFPDKMSPIVTY